MKIVATIEARMSSSRLPNKVLMDFGGIRSLDLEIQRLKRSKYIDEIVIATTDKRTDDPIQQFADSKNISCFRGSEDDILSRILGAVHYAHGDLHVQITGDCPIIDPLIVDKVISTFLNSNGQYDFVSNEITRSYPIGLDCRVFPVKILEEVDKVCNDPIHRVHGSTYIYAGEGKHKYKTFNVTAPKELHYPDWRWTLDTPSDLAFFRALYEAFGEKLINISSEELVVWLNTNLNVIEINKHVRQKNIQDG